MSLRMRTTRAFSIVMIGLHFSSTLWAMTPNLEDVKAPRDLAEWSILVYIQADNSLAPYAAYNINDMQTGIGATSAVNLLVQWDQPGNNKTWRYKINPGARVDAGSLNTEMGYNPENEIVDSMQWIKNSYPAKRYALILWNHGSGIEDFKTLANIPGLPKPLSSWLQIPGSPVPATSEQERGILYDDSQGTLLTNQALASALARTKTILGKNLDIIGMDACLMAMLEVAYQIKGSADYFVSSQQTEPGEGWPYSIFLRPLSANPAQTTPLILAQNIVTAYKTFYTGKRDASDFTQSAINLSTIQAVKQNLDLIIQKIAACQQLDAAITKSMVVAARKASTEFYMPEYIDLLSFYSGLLKQAQTLSRSAPKSNKVLERLDNNQNRAKVSAQYKAALTNLANSINDGFQIMTATIVKNAAGPQMPGARGLSIYYPRTGAIHSSYPITAFAQDSSWLDFIKMYR